MIPSTARMKGSRQQPDLLWVYGLKYGLRGVLALACCGWGAAGRSEAGRGPAGIFLETSSALLEGRTLVGAAADWLEAPGIFLAMSSALLEGLTLVDEAADDEAPGIFLAISSALLEGLTRVFAERVPGVSILLET